MVTAHPGADFTHPHATSRAPGRTAITALLWMIAWAAGLLGGALGEPDEGRYAEVAREMLASGDWTTPRLDGFNFFDKPPLHYWASATAYSLFGVHPWSARLWCALTGLLAIAAVGWAGTRVLGREAGLYAAAILGSSMLFVFGAHVDTLDVGVAAFLALGMACFVVAQFDPSAAHLRTPLNLLMWAALALAVLSKGLIGVVLPGMVLVVYMVWQRDWRLLQRVSLLPGLALLLAISAPWFVRICHLHPDFFDYFFIREHFTRFLTAADNRGKPPGFFLPVVLLGLFPWTLLVPWSRTGWHSMFNGHAAQKLVLVWVAVVFVFFSISHSQLPFYILPLFPAAALLLGQAAAALPPEALARRLRIVAIVALIGAIAAAIAASRVHHDIRHAGMRGALAGLAVALLPMAGAAAWGMTALHRQHRSRAVHGLALASTFSWTLVLLAAQPYLSDHSARPVAEMMQPELHPATEIYMVGTYLRGLPFYLQRLVTIVDQAHDDLRPGLSSRPEGHVATLADFERRWRTSDDGLALVRPYQLMLLQKNGLPYRELGRLPTGVVISRQLTP